MKYTVMISAEQKDGDVFTASRVIQDEHVDAWEPQTLADAVADALIGLNSPNPDAAVCCLVNSLSHRDVFTEPPARGDRDAMGRMCFGAADFVDSLRTATEADDGVE